MFLFFITLPTSSQSVWLGYVYGIWCHFQQYFSYIMTVSFIGGENRIIQRKPPICCKSLTNFVTTLEISLSVQPWKTSSCFKRCITLKKRRKIHVINSITTRPFRISKINHPLPKNDGNTLWANTCTWITALFIYSWITFNLQNARIVIIH